jgi:hypothetical protein
MSSTLASQDDDFNKAGPSTNGATGFRPTAKHTPGRNDNPMVNVEPPRREDLQPSYAQTLHGDDAGAHGWYGSMSKLRLEISQSYIH